MSIFPTQILVAVDGSEEAGPAVKAAAELSRATGSEVHEEIVRLAEVLEVGTIVMGKRGLGALSRALMGSVSESVVRHAHCPVYIIRR
jgi:nucleotide-binding universal stress UspA family protein